MFANADGTLARYSPAIAVEWRSDAMATLSSMHVSDDESVLVVTNTSHVGVLNAATGAVLGR